MNNEETLKSTPTKSQKAKESKQKKSETPKTSPARPQILEITKKKLRREDLEEDCIEKLQSDKLGLDSLLIGETRWQQEVSKQDRTGNIHRIVNTFHVPPNNGYKDARLSELMWFSRKMEEIFFERASLRALYEGGINSMLETIIKCIEKDERLSKLRTSNEIPTTADLERLFTLSGPNSETAEEDLLVDGAVEVNLIPMDRFKYCVLNLKKPLSTPTLYAEKDRKQIQRAPNNRKIVLARYAKRAPVDEKIMKFTITPCTVAVPTNIT